MRFVCLTRTVHRNRDAPVNQCQGPTRLNQERGRIDDLVGLNQFCDAGAGIWTIRSVADVEKRKPGIDRRTAGS